MIANRDDRSHFINGLRAVADFYERHPDAYYDGLSAAFSMYVNGEDARAVLAAMAEVFGEYEEFYDEKYATVARRFGKKVKLELFAPRSKVCHGAVIGTRTEAALVIPAAGEVRIPERLVEVVEWSCLPLLGVRGA